MVEDVEEFASEAKLYPLLEVKLPLKRDIGLCGSETAQHIASEVPLLSGGWLSESSAIEYLAARTPRAENAIRCETLGASGG